MDVLKVFSLLGDSVKPGFFSCLMDIITAEGPPSDVDVRLSASNFFQEAIMSYWQNNRSFIYGYEKSNLRNKLLSHLQEENDQKIAQTLAIAISKIACFDYPQEWPEVFSVLTKQLEKGDLLPSHRILEVLSHTIPTLPGKDLTPKISSRLFDYCWQLWKKDRDIVYQCLMSYNSIGKNTSMGQQEELTFERWSLCLSIIQMLNVFDFRGVAKFRKVPPVEEVCRELIGAIELLVTFYSISPVHPKLNSVHSICVNSMKDLVKIQMWNSTFLGDETVRDDIVEFCLNMLTNTRDEKSPLFEQLLIKCMVMLKSVLDGKCKPIMSELPNSNGFTRVVRRNISKVAKFIPILPDERVKDLCEILIRRYLLLTENDLKEWSEDPERFYLEMRSCHDLDRIEKLRPLAEALFIEVFRRYKRLLGPVVISIFKDATKGRPAKETDSDPEMFLREAAYTAVAHVYYQLPNNLPFDIFFKEVLNPELQSNHHLDMCNHRPDMRIIHRKIAFIVDTLGFQVEGDMRKTIYFALLKLLEYDDLVVRLEACETLQQYLVGIDFQEQKSIDLHHSYLSLCFKLLADVQHFHSKRFVLDCILSVIAMIGEKLQKNSGITNIAQIIFPFADQLANEIEKAWDVSIFTTDLQLTDLKALCFLSELEIFSPVIYEILSPMVEMLSLIICNRKCNYLKYGLQLWESTISKALSCDHQLLELFPYLQVIMKNTLDYCPRSMHCIKGHLPVAIKIIDRYIKLGGGRFLCEQASVIHKILVCIDAILDFKPTKVRDHSKMDTEETRIADKLEALKGQLKDTKTSVEEQEDKKNICALDEIKEKHGWSSSSEVSMMRVLKVFSEDWRKLAVRIRSAGMRPDMVSAAVELGETLLNLGSDFYMATDPREELAAEETNLKGTANHPPRTVARGRKRPRWWSNYVAK